MSYCQNCAELASNLEAVKGELRGARELLALYHQPHTYPEHHMCPGCNFLGQPLLALPSPAEPADPVAAAVCGTCGLPIDDRVHGGFGPCGKGKR